LDAGHRLILTATVPIFNLHAELNFYRLFNEAIEDFSIARVAERQAKALAQAGLPAGG
jgi:hypothetical protein